MNLNQLVSMLMRMFMRRGIRHMTRPPRGPGGTPRSPASRSQQDAARRAAQAARMAKRLGR